MDRGFPNISSSVEGTNFISALDVDIVTYSASVLLECDVVVSLRDM